MFGTRSHTRTVSRPATTTMWSPAQLVAVVVGVAAIVFGAFAIARTGLDLGHLTSPHDSRFGFHHTPLLALTEIGFGVLLVLTAMRPIAGRALMAPLGAVALGFGIIVVLDLWPHRLHDWFGVHDRNGWLFVATGAVVLGAALLLPVVASRRSTDRVTTSTNEDL
jgi:hypothetical protein